MNRYLKIKIVATIFTQIFLIFVAFILQTSVLPIIPIFNCIPNLLLVLVSGYGLVYGEMRGMFYGIIAGVLLDSFHSEHFGVFTLIYSAVGFSNGYLGRIAYEDNLIFRLSITAISELISNMMLYFIVFIFRRNFDFIYYFFSIIFPRVIFTSIFALLFSRYFVYLKIKSDINNYDAHKIKRVKTKKEIEII